MGTNISDRLLKLDTCAVSDAMDALGLWGTVNEINPISVRRRIAGRVQTVKLGPASKIIPKSHLCSAAIDASDPGDVIVVENHTREDAAGWGGILSTAAKHKGVSGTIVDGPARDADESIDLDYPVFARSTVSSTARGRIVEHAWNVPVVIGRVNVEPGDLVIADSSGIVFIPKDQEEEVVAKAEEIAAKEFAMAEAVRSGEPVSQVMSGGYEKMLVSRG